MKLLKRTFGLLVIVLIGAFLHHYLPDRDIVQVVGIEVSREDFKKIDQTPTGKNRDVRYINAEWPNGNPRAYRNEDAPVYLKFDSGNLNAQAQALGNRHGNEDNWVAVKHYGWRIPILSMYPNVLSIKPVDNPDVRLIPWFNIIFFTLLTLLIFWIWSRLRRVKEKHVDPVAEKIGDAADAAGDDIKETRTKVRGFFRRWFGSSK